MSSWFWLASKMVFPAAFNPGSSSLITSAPCLSESIKRLIQDQNRGSSIMACGCQGVDAFQGNISDWFLHVRIQSYPLRLCGYRPSRSGHSCLQDLQIFKARILCKKTGSLDNNSKTFRKIHIMAYFFFQIQK